MKYPIYEDIQSVRSKFFPADIPRRRMTKLTGSLCVEMIRENLTKSDIPVSPRDVFIAGIPDEIDLIIPHRSAQPKYGVIYEPSDVAGVLEVKYSGAYSRDVVPNLCERFTRIVSTCPNVSCAYLTVCENERFKQRVTTERLKFQSFTLYWVNRNYTVERIGDRWESVVQWVNRNVDP
jgi:hypothetical protein